MGFAPIVFDRDWNKKEDFPTYEAHEEKVRADLQYLHNFIRDHYNRHIRDELNAANLPFAPLPNNIDSNNIQDAIQEVNNKIQDVVTFNIPDGSITYAKLRRINADGEAQAVGTDAIRDKAVTGAKIADHTITSDKFAPNNIPGGAIVEGSITVTQMGEKSVDNPQLENNCVNERTLGNLAVKTRVIDNGAVTLEKLCSTEGAEAVDYTVIRDGAVRTNHIYPGAVTVTQLGPEAVESSKIKAGAVTYEKTTGIQKQHIATSTTLASGAHSWTATVDGVTPNNTVLCSAGPDSFAQWADNRIRCTGQGDNTLTFTSDLNTTAPVVVNILILD